MFFDVFLFLKISFIISAVILTFFGGWIIVEMLKDPYYRKNMRWSIFRMGVYMIICILSAIILIIV